MTRSLQSLALIALVGFVLRGDASAGGECASSKLANELLSCSHCQAMKQLLGHSDIAKLSMEVHVLETGAIVEFEAADPTGVQLVHAFVDEMWGDVRRSQRNEVKLSSLCQERFHRLGQAVVDRALTAHGALVVLRASDPKMVSWLREDAEQTRRIVASAVAR